MLEAFQLTGKNILITGASSGLGRQTAIQASKAEANLILTGRNLERLDETFRQLKGDEHLIIPADLTHEDELNHLVDTVPPLNGVVYSTGVSILKPVRFLESADIAENFSIGFNAPVLLTSRLLAKKNWSVAIVRWFLFLLFLLNILL